MIARILAIAATLVLAACKTDGTPNSIENGEAKVFECPQYVIKGRRSYDQHWIDSQVEGGVAAYGCARPDPRPAWIDAPVQTEKVKPAPGPVSKHRLDLLRRLRAHMTKTKWPDQAPAAVEPTPAEPEPPPLSTFEPVRAPPPAPPRDPVDDLLDPK